MKKRFYFFFPVLFISVDLSVVSIALLTTQKVIGISYPLGSYTIETSFFILLSWTSLSLLGKDFKIGRPSGYEKSVTKGFKTIAAFLALFSFFVIFSNQEIVSRTFVLYFAGFLFLFIPIERVIVHLIVNKYRKWGGNYRNAIIIGYDKLGFSLFDAINENKNLGIRCTGFYGSSTQIVTKYPLKGNLKDFLNSNLEKVDFVYVSENIVREELNQIIELSDASFTKVKLLPHFKTDFLKSYTLKLIDNINIIDVNYLPLDHTFNRFLKRSFDVLFSSMMLLFVLSWLYPIIALAIFLESRGPILFKQYRNGKNNEVFRCLKFRTMYLNEEADQKWATKNDHRITYFGAILRRTSLDELPQLINVLIGNMTIVGPRPLPVKLNEQYINQIKSYSQRHTFKPGITGLAQALGHRGEIKDLRAIKNRVTLDRFYLNNWSVFLDVKIIFITFFELIKGQDTAY
ncbi:MAG: exopolysaccharide biosynthesis polyprenyl glycosylphosphotransferase [Cyclobacteriaceae bacterium]|nr:exopolysaccharide biosynthesis polyprenyl glycosylphosphotransferase [Cyclobacteriaceae bacterium]